MMLLLQLLPWDTLAFFVINSLFCYSLGYAIGSEEGVNRMLDTVGKYVKGKK